MINTKDKTKNVHNSEKSMDEKNKIIMVNSFKGGAGKTSIALSYCMKGLLDKTYKNVIYLDVDLLGTGVDYILFDHDQKALFLDEYDDKKTITNAINDINFLHDGKEYTLYAALLNPLSRVGRDYLGKNRLRFHSDVKETVFFNKVKSLIIQLLKNKSVLIVIDCAPGLSDFELSLLNELYIMKDTGLTEVEEVYVTTFDAAHIRKTEDCLKIREEAFANDMKDITIILNDIHNCKFLSQTINDGESQGVGIVFNVNEIANNIRSKLRFKKYKIFYKEYQILLAKNSIVNNQEMMVNNPDVYVFPNSFKSEISNVL